jgi:hypothetical protein
MKVAPSTFSPPELLQPALARGHSFKSALAEAERLADPHIPSSRLARGAHLSDAAAFPTFAHDIDVEPVSPDGPKGKPSQRFGASDAKATPTAPEGSLVVQGHSPQQKADAQASDDGWVRVIRSRPRGAVPETIEPRAHAALASSPTGAHHRIERAVAEDQLVEPPARIGAAHTQTTLSRSGPDGIAPSGEWTLPKHASPQSLPSEAAPALAPSHPAPPSMRLLISGAENLKDDGTAPLGFAEPGVIRPLRTDFQDLGAVAQNMPRQRSPRAAPDPTVEPDRSTELLEFNAPRNQRTIAPRMEAALRNQRRLPFVQYAIAKPRQAPLAAPRTRFVRFEAPATANIAPHRTQSSSRGALPFRRTARSHAPSLILCETTGALELVVGVSSMESDLRARIQRAFDAVAADYGLRVAHLTLNGVSIERANGPKGG